MRRIALVVRPLGLAVEDEVGTVMNECRAGGLSSSCEQPDGVAVDAHRQIGMILSGVNLVVRSTINDHVRPAPRQRSNTTRVGDIELVPVERQHLVTLERARNRSPELAAG